MKNTIYNAIQKQLVIDDGEPSISYKHSEIDTEVKLLTLDELNEIYKKGHQLILDYCTSGCLVYIMPDNTEISINQYDLKVHGDPVFLKIMTPELSETDNEILIACHNQHYLKVHKQWQEYSFMHDLFIDNGYIGLYATEMNKKAALDIYGYDKCMKINDLLNNSKVNKRHMPALTSCMNNVINNNGIIYTGYLPAIGQLMILAKYKNIINFALSYCSCNIITLTDHCIPYWSCCEYSNESALVVEGNGKPYVRQKVDAVVYTLPFFKKIN